MSKKYSKADGGLRFGVCRDKIDLEVVEHEYINGIYIKRPVIAIEQRCCIDNLDPRAI